jgi:hypothetical protein
MFCGSDEAIPRRRFHDRTRTYSLYAPSGIEGDRDSPWLAGFPGQCDYSTEVTLRSRRVTDGTFSLYSVCFPEPGMFSGQVDVMPV